MKNKFLNLSHFKLLICLFIIFILNSCKKKANIKYKTFDNKEIIFSDNFEIQSRNSSKYFVAGKNLQKRLKKELALNLEDLK